MRWNLIFGRASAQRVWSMIAGDSLELFLLRNFAAICNQSERFGICWDWQGYPSDSILLLVLKTFKSSDIFKSNPNYFRMKMICQTDFHAKNWKRKSRNSNWSEKLNCFKLHLNSPVCTICPPVLHSTVRQEEHMPRAMNEVEGPTISLRTIVVWAP